MKAKVSAEPRAVPSAGYKPLQPTPEGAAERRRYVA